MMDTLVTHLMLTAGTISEIMQGQFRVWPDEEEALIDTCHALAAALNLTGDEKGMFMTACGLCETWQVTHSSGD